MSRFYSSPPSASDARGTVKRTHVRLYLLLGAGSAFCLVVLVGILVPMLLLQTQDSNRSNANVAAQETLADDWVGVFRTSVVSAISSAYCLQGFIIGKMRTLPPINGTVAERVEGQYFPRFPELVNMINSTEKNILAMMTVPGGVFLQTEPDIPKLVGYDFLNLYNSSQLRYLSPLQSAQTGALVIGGPMKQQLLPTGSSGWDINLWQPVYNTSAGSVRNLTTFWGFAFVVLSLSRLLVENQFVQNMQENNMNYLLYTMSSSNANRIAPIVTSWSVNASQSKLRSIINDCTSRSVLSTKMSFYVVLCSRDTHKYLSRTNVAIIVCTVVGGALVLFLTATALILSSTREYNGRRYAPKVAPFAMLTLGPCHGDEMWNLASDQMVEVTDKLNRVLAKEMVAHHAYPIPQIHPMTYSYITRTVGSAVLMAQSVLEELQSHPIDAVLCRILGEEDGRILISCAVHWCQDATVTFETNGSRDYRFEGPDVAYGGRMWFFAAPNTVTLSGPANDARNGELAGQTVRFFNSVYLRGVRDCQHLYVITDGTSKRLKEAANVAARHLKRIRDARRRADATGPGGTDSAHDNHDTDPGTTSGSFNNGYAFLHSPPLSPRNSTPSSVVTPNLTAGAGGTVASSNSSVLSGSMDAMPQPPQALTLPDGRVVLGQPGANGTPTAAVAPSSTPLTEGGGSESSLANSVQHASPAAPSAATSPVMLPLLQPALSHPRVITHCEAAEGLRHKESEGHPLFDAIADEHVERGDTAGQPCGAADTGSCVGGEAMQPSPRHAPETVVPVTTVHSRASSVFNRAGERKPVGGGAGPLHIAVPSGNPLVAAGATAAKEQPGVASSGAIGVGSAGQSCTASSGSVSASSGGARSQADALAAASLEYQDAANAALLVALSDDGGGPLGDRRFLGPAGTVVAPATAGTFAGPSSTPPPAIIFSSGASVPTSSVSSSNLTPHTPVDRTTPDVSGSGSGAGGALPTTGDSSQVITPLAQEAQTVSQALLHPSVPAWLDAALRSSFEEQALLIDISYDSVRVLVYYFFASYKQLFRPLTAQERLNIYRRLVMALGVPQQHILEHLAARCVVHYLQSHDEGKRMLWGSPTANPREERRSRKKT